MTMRLDNSSASSMECVMKMMVADARQLFLQHLPRHRVQRGEGLVQQDHVGIVGQHPRDGHARGQRLGIGVLEAFGPPSR